MKKVIHVLNGLNSGGIETLALELIGHAPTGTISELLNTNRQAQHQAAAFAHLKYKKMLSAIHQWSLCDGPLLAWRSFRLCITRRPDAMLIYPCNRLMLWLALGTRLAGVQHLAVAVQNTAPANAYGLRKWHRLLLWFQRFGVKAVPCTQAIVNSLIPLPTGLRLEPVIPNGCDTTSIATRAASARRERPSNDSRRVLMVARLDPIKDQVTLLKAFAAVGTAGWQLQLVGDGPNRSSLESLTIEMGLNPVDVFLGYRNDVPELLGQADLFAFSTTHAEGFGIALIEAMAAGLPVIASDVPACREVLRGGAAGKLLPPGDVLVWSQYLEQFFFDAELRHRLGQNASTHAGLYNIQHIATRWTQLLGG